MQDLPEADALGALQRLRNGEDIESLLSPTRETQMMDGVENGVADGVADGVMDDIEDGVEDGTDGMAEDQGPVQQQASRAMVDGTPSSSSLSQDQDSKGKRRNVRDGV